MVPVDYNYCEIEDSVAMSWVTKFWACLTEFLRNYFQLPKSTSYEGEDREERRETEKNKNKKR